MVQKNMKMGHKEGRWQGVIPVKKLQGPHAQGAPKESQGAPPELWEVPKGLAKLLQKFKTTIKNSYGALENKNNLQEHIEIM